MIQSKEFDKISNSLALVFKTPTMYPSLDFYYDGTYKDWWNRWGEYVFYGLAIIVGIVGTAVSLAIGGAIAGIQSAAKCRDSPLFVML